MFLNYNKEILTSQKQDNENFLLELSRVAGLKKKVNVCKYILRL